MTVAVKVETAASTKRMNKMEDKSKYNRRRFIKSGATFTVGIALAGIGISSLTKLQTSKYVWQIDPFKCNQCGRCATECVINPSAVKCVHAFNLCGYCDLCGGYLKPTAKERNTAAENQLCPTAALERKFIEDPYFEYTIHEEKCIGCAKCVKGCSSFGNGSLHLQIMHHLCVDCNQCSIARVCPSDAISRIPIDQAYEVKGSFINPG